jgi:hypothetical protein
MTKHQRNVFKIVQQFIELHSGSPEIMSWAATSASQAIRSALRTKDREEMIDLSAQIGLTGHPKFIV